MKADSNKGLNIAMWSGPRNISTAMMRSFGSREDSFVSDEPMYGHFLLKSGVSHPMREEVLESMSTNFNDLTDYLTGDIPNNKAVWYQKQMTHHILESDDLGWLKGLRNTFLIRHPKDVILSYMEKFNLEEELIGFKQQDRIYRYVCKFVDSNPVIIDSKDILDIPKKMLTKLCDSLNIPFCDRMLSWTMGHHSTDGVWGKHWYNSVIKTDSFGEYKEKNESIPDQYMDIYNRSLDLYEKLHQKKI